MSKFSSMAELQVVNVTNFSAVSDENVVKISVSVRLPAVTTQREQDMYMRCCKNA